tara:strand:- start:7 stop:546 length:540 start_codon:yes stop_codon:yes gene_type:complete
MRNWLTDQGLNTEKIELISSASRGDLSRANDLMNDTQVASRYELWRSVPEKLGSEGYKVAIAVEEIQNAIDEAQETITNRHTQETDELADYEKQMGTRGSGRKEMEAKQKREIRRFRTDELHFGLSIITNIYKEELMSAPNASSIQNIENIRKTIAALGRNPNEKLLLQSLFISLSELK